MARYPGFCGPSYTSQSPLAGGEICRNWYPEKIETPYGKTDYALYPCPGSASFATSGGSGFRAAKEINGRAFVVAGDKFDEVNSDGTVTNRGTVLNDYLPATISATNTELLIVSGGTAYSFVLASNTFATISALSGVSCAMGEQMDTYFIVLLNDSNQIRISGLLDVSSWDPSDVAAVSVFPDNVESILVDHRELWLFGKTRSTVYWNDGSTFPFNPIPSAGVIEQGIGAAFCRDRCDNSVFWLGKDERGMLAAWRANGYQPLRISNHAIENAWAGYSTVSDAVSFAWSYKGHAFWQIRFPIAGKTWVYDASTNLWHERDYWNAGTSEAHKSQVYMSAHGKHLMGDPASATLYQVSDSYHDDAGNPIRRVRRPPAIGRFVPEIAVTDPIPWRIIGAEIEVVRDGDWFYFDHPGLQIDLEPGLGLTSGQGSDPEVMLRWSKTSGKTWSNEHTLKAGKMGEYRTRLIKRQLGRALAI